MTFPLAAHLCGWPKEVSQDRLRVLQICRDAGYDGVEGLRADSPDDLVELACMAAEHGLQLVNVAAPDPETKARFNTTLGNAAAEIPAQWKRDYEAAPAGVAAAAEAMKPHVAAFSRLGLKPFHHIHIGTLLETPDDCAAILDLVPDLWLLYDTGHLLAANSDPMEVLARWPDRIAHVHLKNFWTQDPAAGWDRRQPDFWKTSRFCDLAEGNVGFDVGEALAGLDDAGYDGWVSIEEDHPARDIVAVVNDNRKFLSDLGY